jgi:hypothetical protein
MKCFHSSAKRRRFSQAEGTGLEPATGKPAIDFETNQRISVSSRVLRYARIIVARILRCNTLQTIAEKGGMFHADNLPNPVRTVLSQQVIG